MNNGSKMAFPLVGVDEGLSKREYFAGLAMQGLCASNLHDAHTKPADWLNDTIESSVEFADELLKELEK